MFFSFLLLSRCNEFDEIIKEIKNVRRDVADLTAIVQEERISKKKESKLAEINSYKSEEILTENKISKIQPDLPFLYKPKPTPTPEPTPAIPEPKRGFECEKVREGEICGHPGPHA
jgi:hypothetical protein